MRSPRWIRRWASTRARYERLVADADHRAATAVKAAGTLREQLAVARQRCDDARAGNDAAQRAATGHARTIGRARELLDKAVAGNTTVGDWRSTAAELRRVLDGWEPDRG